MKSSTFVTATGTGCGKTWVARGLARALYRAGHRAAAIKPIETGCTADPLDAIALARACGQPSLAVDPRLYRARPPLTPYAVTLDTGAVPPDMAALVAATRSLARDADHLIVEGAGGLLAPIDATRTIADLAVALALPILLVAPDALGVLSHLLTAVESAHARNLPLRAVVLVSHVASTAQDPSTRTNHRILTERLPVPVLAFPHTPNDDDALATAAEASGLVALMSGHAHE